MKLTSRLQIGFALPTVFIVVLGIGSVIGFNLINKKVATIYDDRVVPLKQLKEISDDYAIFIIDAVNKADDKLISSNQALTGITKAQERIKKTWGEYIQTYLTPEEADLAGEVEKAFIPANNMLNALVSDLKRGNDQELGKYDGQLYSVIDPVTERIQKLIDLQLDVAQQERNKASEIFNVILWTFIVTSIVLIILVLGPIRIIISKGLIGTVKETINVMASASTEIAASTEEQERLAERQYSSVNRTTTTMDELQASSQQSAQQAETAATGAQQVLTLSENGKYAVRESLEGMSELKDKVVDIAQSITQLSEQIGQINTYQQLVGDIANQTNMLALNAAVEAVRAGEHGKGFSVVATEIRKLADQSKQSADKINQLVSDIQGAINTTVMVTESGTKTVQKGVDIAEKTASTFNNVAQSIEEVVVNLKQISLNVKQQAIAVTEVVGEMNTLNQAANQSATGISQTKIGTQKLSETALNLQEMV